MFTIANYCYVDKTHDTNECNGIDFTNKYSISPSLSNPILLQNNVDSNNSLPYSTKNQKQKNNLTLLYTRNRDNSKDIIIFKK